MNASRRPARPVHRSASVRNCVPGIRCNCPRGYPLCLTIRTMASMVISTDRFGWDNSGIVSLGSAEISELTHSVNLPDRVFNLDEPSAGFKLASHKTGREVLFRLESIARDTEGDILYWEFKPLSSASPMVPTMAVLVYND